MKLLSAESVKIDSESDEKQIDEKTDAPKQKIDSATEMGEIEVAEKEDKTDEILALFDDSTDDLIITQNVEPLQGIEESSFVVEEKENEVFVEPVRDERLLEETRALRNDLRELHRPAPRTESHYQQIKPTQRSRPRTEYISGEQAFKIGKHYGYNEATFSHERYREGLSFHFKQSKINPRFFDAFTQGYIEGGERFLISKQETPAPVSMADEDSSMSPRATAGLAAVSIFGHGSHQKSTTEGEWVMAIRRQGRQFLIADDGTQTEEQLEEFGTNPNLFSFRALKR